MCYNNVTVKEVTAPSVPRPEFIYKGGRVMKITIIGRKCTPRDSFKERAEKRLKKVEKFFGPDAEAKITATVEKNEQIVEVTVFYNSMIFRSQERAANMNDALDRCADSLVRQIRKNKTRVEKKLRSGAMKLTTLSSSAPTAATISPSSKSKLPALPLQSWVKAICLPWVKM